MSRILQLAGGSTIQIREGVLKGIGPQGPIGPTGPQGADGIAGPQGVPGPTGQIDDFYAKAHNSGNAQSVSSNTVTTMGYPTVVKDEPSLVKSLTNFGLPIGLWMVQARVKFRKPSGANASGWRRISLTYDGVETGAATQNCISTLDTEFDFRELIDATAAGRIVQVKVQHSDVVALSVESTIFITRMGPGAVGPAGEQGPAGPPGQEGPTGPQGPAGSLVNNTTTYAAIGG